MKRTLIFASFVLIVNCVYASDIKNKIEVKPLEYSKVQQSFESSFNKYTSIKVLQLKNKKKTIVIFDDKNDILHTFPTKFDETTSIKLAKIKRYSPDLYLMKVWTEDKTWKVVYFWHFRSNVYYFQAAKRSNSRKVYSKNLKKTSIASFYIQKELKLLPSKKDFNSLSLKSKIMMIKIGDPIAKVQYYYGVPNEIHTYKGSWYRPKINDNELLDTLDSQEGWEYDLTAIHDDIVFGVQNNAIKSKIILTTWGSRNPAIYFRTVKGFLSNEINAICHSKEKNKYPECKEYIK